jgi:hypothetical protein
MVVLADPDKVRKGKGMVKKSALDLANLQSEMTGTEVQHFNPRHRNV